MTEPPAARHHDPDPPARRTLGRRQVLGLIGAGAAAAALAACSSDSSKPNTTADSTDSAGSTARSATAADGGATATIPEETAGPFPADGSNGPNVLTQEGVVRRDIRENFGAAANEAAAQGVATDMEFAVVDAATGDPIAGAAVYVWHCDADGRYSVYDDSLGNVNYLRGVQAAGDDGVVTFTTVYPGCYEGRWPHMHFEVYSSLADATSGSAIPIATSQVAHSETLSRAVYAQPGYEASVDTFSRVSLSSDGVFSDGVDQQTPTESGSPTSTLTLRLVVPVNS